MTRAQVAFLGCASCGGCDEAVVDMAGGLLDIARGADIVFWPTAMDFKLEDLESIPDRGITATLVNGAVQSRRDEAMVRLLRRKSRFIVAQGSCAHLGGVPGLANFAGVHAGLERAFLEVPSLAAGSGIPGEAGEEEAGGGSVRPLDQVVEVDYYIPGCPSPAGLVKEALHAVLGGGPPPLKTVFGSRKALCSTCPLRDTRPERLNISAFRRIHEARWEPGLCFLAQEFICMGPVTRGGCDAVCIKGNMPCRGCFGPTENVFDQGARAVAFLASLMVPIEVEDIEKTVDSIPDPAGLFYRYCLAASQLEPGQRK